MSRQASSSWAVAFCVVGIFVVLFGLPIVMSTCSTQNSDAIRQKEIELRVKEIELEIEQLRSQQETEVNQEDD